MVKMVAEHVEVVIVPDCGHFLPGSNLQIQPLPPQLPAPCGPSDTTSRQRLVSELQIAAVRKSIVTDWSAP
jgi:hypothetical protein